MENVAEQRRVTDAELADLQRRYDAEQTIYHQQNEDITNFQNNLRQLKAKQIHSWLIYTHQISICCCGNR